MSSLNFDISPIDALPKTARIVVEGAIDASSVTSFEERLRQLQQDGFSNFVLDMAGIKYVNSTGLGSLVSTADNLERLGGGLALIEVHPKVKVVFDMLGLNSFFKIFPSEIEAVEFLRSNMSAYGKIPIEDLGTSVGSSDSQALYPTTDIPQDDASATQLPSLATPEGEATDIVDKKKRTRVKQYVPPSPDDPQIVNCPNCATAYRLSQVGKYRCPNCKVSFVVDEEYGVELAPAVSQLTLRFTPECREGLGLFLNAMVRRSGFSDDDFALLRELVDEIMEGILRWCYAGNIFDSVVVAFLPARSNLQIKFITGGPALDGTPSEHFPRAANGFTKVDIRPQPKGGNVVLASYRL
ncbi:MAG: anti-sigma factor antagonist [Planctomycetes bacterium]|nr:anti-sigma factor antagonist [Planctomycetota bacterium]